ncbi:uncharacterized protein LY89DRAFT_740817 [Mollisia scopiformis]|uniref:Uncharacterized protein n=1 Tax=Mollisia scopiformis TaxID=149040 RepID=A0A132BBF6_MOLSC|nr:uncharacterized protein LY89DRAFT_740817 [Mollisia scopiformis]KUJ09745.1 hypothetical protein LY89DRAFT_740817 [Mollisia scopiformis]
MRSTLVICWLWLTSFTLAFDASNTSNTCTPPGPLLTTQTPNFAACLIKIDNFTVQERADSGCFGDPNTGVLTYSGCTAICGSDYALWEWKDTVDRLSLLVLPTIVLIAHLAFPPLGWWNYFVVMFHALGNPIGILRSLMTRLERHRRLRRASADVFSGDNLGMRATATVFATYEELSWQDLSGHFSDILIGKRLDPDERALLMRASHRLSSTRLASTSSAAVAIAALVATLASAIVQTIKQFDEVNTRVYNETAGTIAVMCIMFMSIPQVWFSARLGTFTTDSGASHILETMNERMKEVINKKELTNPLFPPLQLAVCPLQPRDRRPVLLLWLFERLPSRVSAYFDSFFSHCPLEPIAPAYDSEDARFIRDQVDYSSYISLNSAWRPCKHLAPDLHGRSHTQLTVISLLSVVFGACLPAVFLSLTNRSDQRPLAVGCRSLSWMTILGIWLSSFVLDSIFRFFVCRFSYRRDPVQKVRLLWQWTIAKDAFIACTVLVVILLVELGRYNSCWCRASFSKPFQVELFQFTAEQWSDAQIFWTSLPGAGLFINLTLILAFELRWKEWWGFIPWFRLEGGSPLCKTGREMQAELDELKVLERKDHEHIERVENTVPEPYDPGYKPDGAVGVQEYGEISNGQAQEFWRAQY